jgi:site-specific DNA-cytosine methylase
VTQATCLEICAGAGGQALGLESAGFSHTAAVEIEPDACETLSLNRPNWDVRQTDVRELNGRDFRGIDLLAGGVPCPPFSVAGHQLGGADERDLFPDALRLVREAKPAAVMLENVRGLAAKRFANSKRLATKRTGDCCQPPTSAFHNCGRGSSSSRCAREHSAVSSGRHRKPWLRLLVRRSVI